MARVNVEERFFAESRVKRLAKMMHWTEQQAMGTMVYLWHDSQEVMAVHGSAEELASWALLDPEDTDRFVEALLKVKLITETGPDQFEIHGNREQIEALVSHVAKSKKGGDATRRKWQAKKEAQAKANPEAAEALLEKSAPVAESLHEKAPGPTTGIATGLPAGVPQVGSMQFNAIQCNSYNTGEVGGANVPRGVKTEANQILQLIISQEGDPRRGVVRPSRDAVQGLANALVSEFGIEVIRDLRSFVKQEQMLGKARWDPEMIHGICVDIRNGAHDDRLGKKKASSGQEEAWSRSSEEACAVPS